MDDNSKRYVNEVFVGRELTQDESRKIEDLREAGRQFAETILAAGGDEAEARYHVTEVKRISDQTERWARKTDEQRERDRPEKESRLTPVHSR